MTTTNHQESCGNCHHAPCVCDKPAFPWTNEDGDPMWLRAVWSPDAGGGHRDALTEDVVAALLAADPETRMRVMLAMPDESMAVEERKQREAAEKRAAAAEAELSNEKQRSREYAILLAEAQRQFTHELVKKAQKAPPQAQPEESGATEPPAVEPASLNEDEWQKLEPDAKRVRSMASNWDPDSGDIQAGSRGLSFHETLKEYPDAAAKALRRMRDSVLYYANALLEEINEHHYSEVKHHAGHIEFEARAMGRLVDAMHRVLRGEPDPEKAAAVEPGGPERVSDCPHIATDYVGKCFKCGARNLLMEQLREAEDKQEQSEREAAELKAEFASTEADRHAKHEALRIALEETGTLRAQLTEAQRENEALGTRVQEEDARAVAWMDTADQRLRERDALRAERDGMLEHGLSLLRWGKELAVLLQSLEDANRVHPHQATRGTIARLLAIRESELRQSPTSASPAKLSDVLPTNPEDEAIVDGLMAKRAAGLKETRLGGAVHALRGEIVAALRELAMYTDTDTAPRHIAWQKLANRLERGGKL